MNNVLELKGRFETGRYKGRVGAPMLSGDKIVNADHLDELANQLMEISSYWGENTIIDGAIISVHYRMVVAKSNRIKVLLKEKGKDANEGIRGARFADDGNLKEPRHIFTYYVSIKTIDESAELLKETAVFIRKNCNGKAGAEELTQINQGKYVCDKLSKSTIAQIIVDSYYVEAFGIDKWFVPKDERAIVTFYGTKNKTSNILSSIGINLSATKKIDDNTFVLTRAEQEIVYEKLPYIVAMGVVDMNELNKDILEDIIETVVMTIPDPKDEPWVGVIDTQFDDSVYFHKWVDSHNMLDENITVTIEDKVHGTGICSIIVDGHNINPDLDDGCGRFRVRHFGVATSGKSSSVFIMRSIEQIVKSNLDIKVWNISLGSAKEIADYYISPEGALLDRLENEYDVVFIVAGTNKPINVYETMKIGSPADSINSIVVNSVDFHGKIANYTRQGPVLSFFHKPDVSYYGGDREKGIRICSPMGEMYKAGTSYAAPWIARKMAYMISKLGLSREAAKALLIDSAAGWARKDDTSFSVGYGIVPIRIEDIIKTKEDEIRFVITNRIMDYETYTYNIPIPQNEKGFPFVARATLVYYPRCDRNQGVDYTCTELDLHFGRLKESKGKVTIDPINRNSQGEEDGDKLFEGNARKMFRKWDNVKHISEKISKSPRARSVYGVGLWGLMVRSKERLNEKSGQGMQFGVVITLKEIDGINRIQEFMNLCQIRGWIVNRLDVDIRSEVYALGEQDIEWE